VTENLSHVADQKASSFEEAFFASADTHIHPTSLVGPSVQLGQGVKVGPFCTIVGNTTIGDGTRLYPHTTIGYPGQVVGLKQTIGRVEIGQNCEIREFATIHAPRTEQGATKVGNNCYLMNYAHVSHDVILEDNVTLINCVNLGGHTYIEKNAIVMANSATHQFTRIGQFTALAPFSGIRQDLPPFCLFSGQPARFYGLNVIGLKRAGFSRESINALKHLTKLFYQEKLTLDVIEQQAQQDPSWGAQTTVQLFLAFVKQSSRGVARKAASEREAQQTEMSL
jgi:UDP-N-acetylglucosamine acyltransferase